MTVFDYVVLAIVVLSVALGWWRGFVYELLSVLGWVAAYFIARLFAPDVAQHVPDAVGTELVKTALAYAAIFIATLLVGGVLAWALSKLIKLAGLGMLDGSLGALFGLARGVLLVLVLVWLSGLTDIPQQRFWRDALLSKPLQDVAVMGKDFLPDNVAKKVSY